VGIGLGLDKRPAVERGSGRGDGQAGASVHVGSDETARVDGVWVQMTHDATSDGVLIRERNWSLIAPGVSRE